MKVSVETLSPIEKKLLVEVEPERVAEELERAYKGLSRQVKIPGFRPGRIPRHILEARFRDQVEQEVAQELIEHSFRDAVGENSLLPVGSPVVSPDKLEKGKPFKFEARVEVKPEVAPQTYKGLSYPEAKVEVTDAMVEAELTQLQEQLATMKPIEDRQAAITGDYAVVDFVGLIDGQPFPGNTAEGLTLQVEAGALLEGKAPFLAGVTVGEKVSTEAEFPADFPQEGLRGKKAVFEVTLKSLKKREVPALDDEFAKDVGTDAKTLDELKAKIRENLQKAEEAKAERNTREALVKELIEKNPFEVPKSMIERAIDMMVMGAAERFARQGLDIRQLGLDFRKLREDLREKATTEVRAALIFEAIAKQEGLEVSDEDLSEHYKKVAAESRISEAKVRAHFEKDPEEREGLVGRLREEKAYELVKREAKPVVAG